MVRPKELISGLVGSAACHLALVPILSLYGVHICPVLSDRGLAFGCMYSGAFVATVIVFNFVGVVVLFGHLFRGRPAGAKTPALQPARLAFVLAYVVTYAGSALALSGYLNSIEAPGPTVERMQFALAYSGILLGILHLSIVDWILVTWYRDDFDSRTDPGSGRPGPGTLTSAWFMSVMASSAPVVGAALIATLFGYRLVLDLADRRDIPVEELTPVFREFAQTLALLGGWILVVHLFHLLKQRRYLRDIQAHLEALAAQRTDFFSLPEASSFWRSVFTGLNRNTVALQQRSRLIQGFSSYVARSVVDGVGSRPGDPERRASSPGDSEFRPAGLHADVEYADSATGRPDPQHLFRGHD